MSGEIVYFELPGHDAAATQRFWSSLFDWTFNEGNFPGYSMIDGPSPMGGTRMGTRRSTRGSSSASRTSRPRPTGCANSAAPHRNPSRSPRARSPTAPTTRACSSACSRRLEASNARHQLQEKL